GDPGAQPQRRQPAEGAAGPLADPGAAAAHPGRAHPRHRRGRQDRDPAARRRAVRRRRGGAVHLRRTGGGAAAQPQGRGAARPPPDRRAAQRRRPHQGRDHGDHRERRADLMRRLLWPILALALLLLVNLIFTPGFFSIQLREGHLYGSLIDILRFGAPLILVSLGMTLVIATGGIDLSVGSIVAIAGALACLLIDQEQGVLVAVVLALGLSMLLGAWNGFLVAAVGIQPIIATLILMVAGRGLAQLITGG